jgi:hypothetical protein
LTIEPQTFSSSPRSATSASIGLDDQIERFLASLVVASCARRPAPPRSQASRHGLGGAAGGAAPCARPLALFANKIVVVDELVAVRDQQVGRRVLDAHADHRLVVLAQLRHERREIRIAADDDERVDVRFRVAKIERVDDHPDIAEFLPDWRTCGISIISNDASCIGALNDL